MIGQLLVKGERELGIGSNLLSPCLPSLCLFQKIVPLLVSFLLVSPRILNIKDSLNKKSTGFASALFVVG
jgi:hypothetical protein